MILDTIPDTNNLIKDILEGPSFELPTYIVKINNKVLCIGLEAPPIISDYLLKSFSVSPPPAGLPNGHFLVVPWGGQRSVHHRGH